MPVALDSHDLIDRQIWKATHRTSEKCAAYSETKSLVYGIWFQRVKKAVISKNAARATFPSPT